jgi:hypothetical protein
MRSECADCISCAPILINAQDSYRRVKREPHRLHHC